MFEILFHKDAVLGSPMWNIASVFDEAPELLLDPILHLEEISKFTSVTVNTSEICYEDVKTDW